MKVIYRNNIFVALVATSAERDAVRRAGFAWHPAPDECKLKAKGGCHGCKAGLKKPAWWTRRKEAAARLSAYADEDAKKALAKHLQAVKMSRATDAQEDIPAPKGLSYLGYQRAGVVYMAGREGTLLGDEQGLGKAQPLDAKVLTPHGWKKMGDIAVGDLIVNSAGTTSKVTGVFPQGIKDIYRVEFQDGSATECCDEHLWNVNTPIRYKRGNPFKTLPLSEIRKSLHTSWGAHRHYTPIVKPLSFSPPSPLPLSPYLLGYIIGNGGLSQHSVRITIPDQETVERLSSLLPDDVALSFQQEYEWIIASKSGAGTRNSVLDALRRLGLMGRLSCEKFLPREYQWALLSDRFALLQGLLDSDGHVRPKDGNIEFSTSSPQLAHDVQQLIWSLGGNARIRIKKTTHLDAHRMSVILPPDLGCPFLLHRKAVSWRPRSKYLPVRMIASVTFVGRKEARCISVDSADHLYITDDFILTHNTVQVLGLINYDQTIKNVLIVCPATLRTNWGRKEGPRWLVNDGRKWLIHIVDEDAPVPARANFVVVHYNRVTIGHKRCDGVCGGQKRKTIPCPKCKGTGNGPRHPLLCEYCKGNKHVFCPKCKGRGRYPATNVKVVESLYARKWDLIVCDEAHFLKNPQARRTKAILGDRYKKKPGLADLARKRLFLTGTPIPNRPFEIWPIVSALAPETFSSMKAFMKRYCGGHEEWVSKTKKIWKFDGATNLEELQEKLRGACMIRRLKQDVLKELPPKRRQIISLPPSEEAKVLIAQEASEWNKKFASDMAIVEAAAQIASETGDQHAWDAAADKLRYIQKVAFVEMARIRRQLAIVKVPLVIEHLEGVLEEGVGKIICFAHHKEVILKLQQHFGSAAVSIFGETKMNERQRAVDVFQDPKSPAKLFIGGIMAAGTGITLTASSNVVFAEEDWTPGTINQCEDRAHRIGQLSSVLVQHLVLDGSLDARMIQMIVEKQEIADRALDRSTDVQVGSEPALPRPDVADEQPVPPVELWKKVALKEALLVIAKRRDAETEGGRGFSQFDTAIGNSLANSKGTFSDKQAHLAAKFVAKYRFQLSESNPHLAKQLGVFELPPPPKMPGFQKRESRTVLDRKQIELIARLVPPNIH